MASEFSYRTRALALERFGSEIFDLLVIGGGITGAATARDAALRGMKVALVERCDFAYGTSSRSSKLIHGGLRYLENFELKLVFEALAERALLLKTAPNRVRPLPFYFPVYQGDPHGRFKLGLGMWLYDLLTLFKSPGWHRSLSAREFVEEIPVIQSEGLKGAFRYFDASMWDDMLAIEILRSAAQAGAAIASYTEARVPLRNGDQVAGFSVLDRETGREIQLRAHQTVACAGPWTDELGRTLSQDWKRLLNPSQGVHLVFDLKRLPVPGALVMSHPEDGRIAFVIPRPDYGAGVVIVGTTDSPSPEDPSRVEVGPEDVSYLLGLLSRYFPKLGLNASDILSAYVGVRPLVASDQNELQKVSREHTIGRGPGGVVIVAGGKYTTHRKMAQEIVDFSVSLWAERSRDGLPAPDPRFKKAAKTEEPPNPLALTQHGAPGIPDTLLHQYGAEAEEMRAIQLRLGQASPADPEGFPWLGAQLVHAIRQGAVLRLEDFFLRRVPLFLAREDGGRPWAGYLAKLWAEERGLDAAAAEREHGALLAELDRRSAWRRFEEPVRAAQKN